MANEKISAMPAASALDGAELVPLVQSGGNVRATAQDVANLGFLQRVTVPIGAMQLTTLHSAPVQIVADPGNGKRIVFVAGALQLLAGPAGQPTFSDSNLGLGIAGALVAIIDPDGLHGVIGNSLAFVCGSAATPAEIAPGALVLSSTDDMGVWGEITSISVTAGNAGLLYADGDLFNISGASGDAIGIVTGVGAGGAVTSVAVTGAGTNPGTSYTTGTGNATVPISPSLGDGNLQVDIVVSTPQTGTAQVDVAYYLINTLT